METQCKIDAFVATRIIVVCARNTSEKLLMAMISEKVSAIWPEVDKEKKSKRLMEGDTALFQPRLLTLDEESLTALMSVLVAEAANPLANGENVLNALKISTALGARSEFLVALAEATKEAQATEPASG